MVIVMVYLRTKQTYQKQPNHFAILPPFLSFPTPILILATHFLRHCRLPCVLRLLCLRSLMEPHHHHLKSSSSSSSMADSSSTISSVNQNPNLQNLNKLSYKISKQQQQQPILKKHPQQIQNLTNNLSNNLSSSSSFNNNNNSSSNNLNPQSLPPAEPQIQQQQQQGLNPQQPPVYNINKSDFRTVVQKLTGSPAHTDRLSTPQPIQPPKPPSSRLQRIRPPPLPILNDAVQLNPAINRTSIAPSALSGLLPRMQMTPLSPLPPFPSVHAAAESPISSYLRYLHSSTTSSSSGLPFPPQALPLSPLAFGCLPSPRSPYPLLSPNLFSSGASQLGFPPSPGLSVPSPRWRDV